MKCRRKWNSLVLLLLLLVKFSAQASDSLDNIVIADLKYDWLVFDKEYKSYFPVSPARNKFLSLTQLIDLNKYSTYNLNFKAAPHLSLFVNEKLVYRNNSGSEQNVRLKIDSLEKIPGNEKEIITFYNATKELPAESFFIGISSSALHLSNARFDIPLFRNTDAPGSLYLTTFLIIMTGVAILKNKYPKKYNEFFRFSGIVPDIDTKVVWDIASIPVLLFIIINSFCAALILFGIKKEYALKSLSFLNILDSKSVVGILTVGGIVFMLHLLKYLQLKIMGWIFNLKDIVKHQFFELMKVSVKINMLLAVIILIFFSSQFYDFKIHFDFFFYFLALSLLIVLFRVGYLIFTFSGFRNVYLFSYLCTTEILPLIIIVKLVLY